MHRMWGRLNKIDGFTAITAAAARCFILIRRKYLVAFWILKPPILSISLAHIHTERLCKVVHRSHGDASCHRVHKRLKKRKVINVGTGSDEHVLKTRQQHLLHRGKDDNYNVLKNSCRFVISGALVSTFVVINGIVVVLLLLLDLRFDIAHHTRVFFVLVLVCPRRFGALSLFVF